MKVKRLCGIFSIGALAALTLVGCGYDQNTGGVDEQATIVDSDLSYLKTSTWGFGTKTVYDDTIDLASGYSYVATLSNGEELNFSDITGVESIEYTYYKKTAYTATDIYKQSVESYEGAVTLWDEDKIHVNPDTIGSVQPSTNVKVNGEYLIVLSFEVNEKRYKPIQDLVMQLNVYTESVINEDNFSFKQKTVTLDQVGSGVTNYATVTLDDETIELDPSTLDDTTLAKLGLSAVSYKYYTDSSKSAVTVAPTTAGQTYVFITLTPATGYETPVVDGYYAVIYVQDSASTKTITYVMNNDNATQIDAQTTTASTFTDDLLPTPAAVDGYEWVGWYADEALTTQVNTLTTINGNMTLYGKWNQTAYTVSYDENLVGVTTDDATLVTAIPSTLPTLTDTNGKYTFGGWYTDVACTTEATAGATITADTTLYAKWTRATDLDTNYLLQETFDIIHPESMSNVEISGGNTYTNTDGALVITPDGTNSGTIDFDFTDIEITSTEGATNTATVQFTLTEAAVAASWASFALYDGSGSVILDNNYSEKGKFGIRFGGQTTDTSTTEYEKTAGTAYTYTITALFTSTGMTINVTVTDGTNDYTLVTNKEITKTSIGKIRFGNASNAARILTLDNLNVSNVETAA